MPRRRNEKLLRAVGARISKLRKDRGLTQEQLAEEIDVTVEFLGRCEKGKAAMSLSNLVVLAGVLDVSLGNVLDAGKAAPKPKASRDELELMRLYRRMSSRERLLVLDLAPLGGSPGKPPHEPCPARHPPVRSLHEPSRPSGQPRPAGASSAARPPPSPSGPQPSWPRPRP